MKKYLNKDIILNTITLLVFSILVEIIFKTTNFFKILDWSLLRILLFNLFISFVISIIEYFIPKKFIKYINIILISIYSIYSLAETGFNSYIGVYMSLGTSSQLGAVTDYIREYIFSFRWFYWFNLLPCILIILYYIFLEKIVVKKFNIKKNKFNYNNIDRKLFIKKGIIYLICSLIIFGIYISTLFIPFMQNKLQSISNIELFISPSVPSITIKEFGVINFGYLDVRNYFIPIEVKKEVSVSDKKKESVKDTSRNIDDTKWNDLISSETNITYNNLNNYFINRSVGNTNSYTGMFKDKNLIVIMMESVNDIIINEDDYPNFYKLYSEGWHWNNNYSPRNSCSTGNNELSAMVSLYSIYNTCTANIYKNNTYYESIFNMFNNNGYYSFSAHDYTEAYYYRSTIHANMGSLKYYGVQDLGIDYKNEYRNWASDEDFMKSVLNILDNIESDNFMAWLTTVSSHQPYSVSSIEGDKYLDLYNDLDLKTDLKRYKSKLKILDEALGILIDGLESKGILDDTVIVLFGDHYPYGLSNDTINSVLDYDTNVDHENERVPFVIYNSELGSKEFNEYTSYINILPTLLNLFGIDYDPRLYMGSDLLSEDYTSMVVFADGSWKNEFAYYNASKSSIEYYKDIEYSIDQLKDINENINNKISMSSLAIKNNYFEYLSNNLKEESSN